LPLWLEIISILPPALLIGLMATADTWKRWAGSSDWERLLGITWIAIATVSAIWIVVLALRPKPPHAKIILAVHIIVVLATISLPGGIMIPWLMHWDFGPGG
jgi:heme A synthase